MDRCQLRAICLYERKLGTSYKDAADLIHTAFGPGTTTERTVQRGSNDDDGNTTSKVTLTFVDHGRDSQGMICWLFSYTRPANIDVHIKQLQKLTDTAYD